MAISLVGTASNDGSTGTAVSVTHGLTIASGDVVIATVMANGAGNTVTDNNGSYPFNDDHYTANPESATFAVFSHMAGASEPSAYAFTLGSSNRWSVVVRVYRGVHSSIWDVAPSASTVATGTNQATAVAPAITIVTGGACGLVLLGDDYAPTTTTYSSVGNGYSNAKSESGQQYQATADKLGLSVGATGTTAVTSSANVTYVIYQVALKPEPDRARYDTTAAIDESLWQIMVGNNTQGWRDITGEISGLTYSHVRPGGAASCSFTISADVEGLGYNELQPDQLLAVRYEGELVWDGYILPRGINYRGA